MTSTTEEDVSTTEADLIGYLTSLSNWGRWGDDDVRGTLNLIGPEQVRAASECVREGIVVHCGRQISAKHGPDNPSPLMHHMMASGTEAPPEGFGSAYDWFGMGIHGHSFTHLDALGHVFWDGKQYNGRSSSEVQTLRGAISGSIEPAAKGVVTRGVLFDVPRALGREFLDPGEQITPKVLEQCEVATGLSVGKGDALLVRIGRDSLPGGGESNGWAGLHASCLPWLHEREISILGSDSANDVSPSGFSTMRVPIHVVGIVAMGLWLLDNALLDPLASACNEAQRWSFLFSMAPLDLKNTTGSPVNPLAVL
jgi:kynurenine formamidase